MTEAQMMAGLIDAARTLGYLVLHLTDARRSEPYEEMIGQVPAPEREDRAA